MRYLALFLCVLLTGCTTVTRYRVPASSPDGIACARECRSDRACMASCPEAQVEEGARCSEDDVAHDDFCKQKRSLSTGGIVGIAVGGALLVSFLVLMVAGGFQTQ